MVVGSDNGDPFWAAIKQETHQNKLPDQIMR